MSSGNRRVFSLQAAPHPFTPHLALHGAVYLTLLLSLLPGLWSITPLKRELHEGRTLSVLFQQLTQSLAHTGTQLVTVDGKRVH